MSTGKKLFLTVWSSYRFGEKIMKKNRVLTAALCTLLAASSMLGACQKKESNRGIYKNEGDEDTKPTPTETPQLPDPTPTEAEPEPEPEPVSKDFPALAISSRYSNFDVDQNGYDLAFDYELLHTEREYGNAHPELRDALEEVNSFIEEIVGEGCSGYAEILSGMSADQLKHEREMGEYPKYSYNKVYTRRVDDKIVSYIYENRSFDLNDEYDSVGVRGYNFYVEDGSEVKLSDVVADEDALYDLLAEKLSLIVHDGLGDMMDYPIDPAKTKEEMLGYIDMYQSSWVLEPQGISFYFDTFTFMPWTTSVNVLFSEDTNGEIFTDEFRNDVCDEWVMKLPQNTETRFDAEDDGVTDVIRVCDMLEPNRGGDYHFDPIVGVNICYNGDINSFTDGEQPYDYEAYLIHKDGKSVLLVNYSEYDFGYMDTYDLAGSKVYHAESISGWVEYLDRNDWLWGDETIYPQRVITKTTDIPVTDVVSLEGFECKSGILNIGIDASLNVEWE